MRVLLTIATLLLFSMSEATNGGSSSATSRLRGRNTSEERKYEDVTDKRGLQQENDTSRIRLSYSGGALRSRDDRTANLEPEVCGYCQEQGCVTGTNVVDFGGGARATCDLIMSIAPKLTPFQCSVDREIIEDTCCCDPSATAALPSEDEETDPCDFCDGDDFIPGATIEFSSGSFASCKSFKDLLDVGMPAGFCRKERKAIENACCVTVSQREPEPVKPSATTSMSPRTETNDESDHCDFCVGKEFQTNPIITFSTGTKVSCGGVNELMEMFPQSFCSREKEIIEETCCPSSDQTAVNAPVESRIEDAENNTNPLPKVDPCDFCVGHVFLEQPIIEFAIIDDSVSCGGLKTVLDTGLPELFCTSQRESIEKACCGPPLPGTGSSAHTTSNPTGAPTGAPTGEPTGEPTATPTLQPTSEPTFTPTDNPTTLPTAMPTSTPTATPTTLPTSEPTAGPTEPIAEAKFETISGIIDAWVTTSANSSVENATEVISGEEVNANNSTEIIEDESGAGSLVSIGPTRPGFFALPPEVLEGENDAEQNQNHPISSDQNRLGFFASPHGNDETEYNVDSTHQKPQGIVTDPVGEVEAEFLLENDQMTSPTLRADESEISVRKRTGLFKVNPVFDNDALKDTLQMIKETIQSNQKNGFLFSGGIRRGRAKVASF